MRKSKYTNEVLNQIKDCETVSEALHMLGLKRTGGHKDLRARIRTILESNGTFKGQSHLAGKNYIKVPNDEFFTANNTRQSTSIRNALFNRGIKDRRCESCNNEEWVGSPIPLEVHHMDGDKTNNQLSNLQILCPNCHALTDTYKTKNSKFHNGR
jgi:hypothetical protein